MAAREQVFEKDEGDSFGRDAPFGATAAPASNIVKLSDALGPVMKENKKAMRRQKVIRFINATYAGQDLQLRIEGMMGLDPEKSDQWWFDHIDGEMKRADWDDMRDKRDTWQRLSG